MCQLQDSFEPREINTLHGKKKWGRSYYPAGGLPVDAVLVVRTEELRKFEQKISGNAEEERSLRTTERNTLLTIIAALCDYSNIKYQERGVVGQIERMTQEIGAPVTDDTNRTVLAKIPAPLETRKN